MGTNEISLKIQDGYLRVDGFSIDNYRELYNKLRVAVLDCGIEHYRVSAFHVEYAINAPNSSILKIPEVGYSYSELSFMLRDICIVEPGGAYMNALHRRLMELDLEKRRDSAYVMMSVLSEDEGYEDMTNATKVFMDGICIKFWYVPY